MVEVRASRVSIEALAAEGVVAGVTRADTQVAAFPDDITEVQASRASIEILAQEPTIAGVTRTDTQVASLPDNITEVQASRASIEILASSPPQAGVTRSDTQVAALFDDIGQVLASRASIEVLARQGSAGPITPLPLADDNSVFLHNWVTRAEVTSSFRTDVTYSPASGAESRRGLTVKPFRTMKLEWQVGDDLNLEDLERLEVMLRRMGDQRFQVPLYPDQQELDASYLSSATTINVPTTQARFFPGGRVVIVQLDWEGQPTSFSFHTIDSLSSSSLTFPSPLGVAVPAGSLVFPVLDCEVMLEVEANLTSARVPSVRLTVAEVPGASQLPPLKSDIPLNAPQYDDLPIWHIEPDWSQGIKKGRERYGSRKTIGRADFVSAEGDRARQTHSFTVNGKRQDQWNALEFFETRRGRLRAFWHIDQDQYFECVDIDPSGTFISVSEIGDLADFIEEFDFVGFLMADGTYYVREAVTIQQVLTVFRITMDTPVAAGLLATDVVRIARARKTRFMSDAFTEVWTHTGYGASKIQIVETINEEDFPA